MHGDLPEESLDISTNVLAMRSVARGSLKGGAVSAMGRVPEGLENFSLFFSKPHPALPGVFVTTGIEYRTDQYPETYDHVWCYIMVGHNGATIRVEVGTKTPHREVVWLPVPNGTLAVAGIGRDEADASRTACQFPADAI